jgi:hypothetical protein
VNREVECLVNCKRSGIAQRLAGRAASRLAGRAVGRLTGRLIEL